VNRATGEIVEGECTEVKEQPESVSAVKEHWCEEHNCAFELKKSRFGSFYAHKIEGGWCNEIKKKEKQAVVHATADEPDPEMAPNWAPGGKPEEPSPNTIESLKETMQLCNWSTMDIGQFCNAEKRWNIREFKDLTPERIAELVLHIQKNAK